MENKNLVREVNFFYMLTFLFTGILYGLSTLICKIFISGFAETVLLTTMSAQLAPSVARFISKKRYKKNNKLIIKFKFNGFWLIAIFVPLISVFAQHLVLETREIFLIKSPLFATSELIILSLFTTIIGSIGEEIGWRGYLYYTLRTQLKPWISSLITGLLWGLWHFTKIFHLGVTHYILFTLSVIPISILMTYVNDRANGSIVPSIIFHTVLNLSFMYLLFERETIIGYLISILFLSIISLFIRFIDTEYFNRKMPDAQNHN